MKGWARLRAPSLGVWASSCALLGQLGCPAPGGQDEGETEDADTGETGGNELPPTPTLRSPADGASGQAVEGELCWNLVDDPEGDAVRYRVVVDDAVLTQGLLGEEGYEGPCAGPLNFNYEQTYRWYVQAFEAGDPARASEPSEEWTFTTAYDGLSQMVFADEFDEDLGWEISGDASAGAWVRGLPVEALAAGEITQHGRCSGGTSCMFTGQNPEGVAGTQSVGGGSTVLLSPTFDLGNAAAGTVQLRRTFYRGSQASGELVVELMVPEEEGEGEAPVAYPLEALNAPTQDTPENLWTPVEYALCGAPMRDGSRLRITAANGAQGVLEAAIDSVSVHAHDEASICATGVGGFCNPAAPGDACPDEMLCCGQHVLNDGVFRCSDPVAGLDFENPPAEPDDPGNGAMGCDAPDLITDPLYIEPAFNDIMVTPQTCELQEGCVGGIGLRQIMRFGTAVPNIGSRDLVMGIPANNPDLFHYSACHDHFHFDGFAGYELRDGDDVVTSGHKQAFCMLDTISWAWPFELSVFDCANQGISRGFTDVYEAGLPCQWIDITGIDPGEYTLRIELNPVRPGDAYRQLNEQSYENNVVEMQVFVP